MTECSQRPEGKSPPFIFPKKKGYNLPLLLFSDGWTTLQWSKCISFSPIHFSFNLNLFCSQLFYHGISQGTALFLNFIYGACCYFPMRCCEQGRQNDAQRKTPSVSDSSTLSLIPLTEAWAVKEYILLDTGMTFSCVFSAARWQIISLAIAVFFSYSWNPGVGRNIKKFVVFHLPLANRIMLKPSKMDHSLSVVLSEVQTWRRVIGRMLGAHLDHAIVPLLSYPPRKNLQTRLSVTE